ncbi:uncharacterized protein LOC131650374 [Vicia villosa]|uniref:uncharacterized protein LOC131650374 n=1 Tax=Vicia villosa TaxID=3911 RepID=UPI00273C2AC3|nr:uncharacterized protein LOC131650374 [Vicia villosa]
MGQVFRKLFDTFFGNSEMRVVILGLDAAGKTTILYKLHIGEVLSTVPTIGFNVEKVQYKNVVFTVWDVGGQEKLRPLWRHYFNNTDGLIYVIDSLDRERIGQAKLEFQAIINDPFMLNSVILVFANKQDLRGAMTPMEVCEGLGLFDLKNRKWHIQGTCALKGDGLYEGLDWLASTLKAIKAEGTSSFVGIEDILLLLYMKKRKKATHVILEDDVVEIASASIVSLIFAAFVAIVDLRQALAKSTNFKVQTSIPSLSVSDSGHKLQIPEQLIADTDTDMGQAFRKLFDTLFGNSQIQVLMVGLDNAGKTTILYKLQIGKVVTTIPTVGFNVEKVEYKNVDFTVWDAGSQGLYKLRPLWKHYFDNNDCLIYVVDSTDRERIDQAKQEFQVTINEPTMLNNIILVFANKQDLKGAMTLTEVCEGLGLFELRNRKWYIQGTCALRGDGLFEGLDWLASTLKEKKAAEYS